MLKRYFSILEGKEKPKFIIARKSGLLDRKLKEAGKIMRKCEFCERKCKVNRLEGEKGFCNVGKEWRIFGSHTHYGEEVELVPSATLFLAGCALRCVYCQNAPNSISVDFGKVWKDSEVGKWIDEKFKQGCRNINFVTPDCYVWQILKVLNLVKAEIPVVWNSSSYYSSKTAELIKDVVDIYLLDFRYFNDKCALRLSQADNYVETAKRNFLLANKDSEMIIRVLVLPGHTECCAKPILKWIAENLPNVRVNIMEQYQPRWQANKFKEINRILTFKEYEDVINYAKKLGLKNLG